MWGSAPPVVTRASIVPARQFVSTGVSVGYSATFGVRTCGEPSCANLANDQVLALLSEPWPSWPSGFCRALPRPRIPARVKSPQKQEEKAAVSQPYEPSRYEKFMTGLESSFVSPPSGFYPVHRQRLFRRRLHAWSRLPAVLRARSGLGREGPVLDQELQADRGRNPHAVEQRWPLDGGHSRRLAGRPADWLLRDRPGQRPKTTARTSESSRPISSASGAVRPTRWTRLEGEVAYEDYENEEGQGKAPSIETAYDAASAPGLFQNIKYIRSQGTAAIDWRSSPGYSRKGGYYGVVMHDYADQDKTYSFRRLDGEVIQHLPILRENWVLSFRGRVQSTLDDDDNVPYYLLPSLGSGRTLRGYSTGRFRNRHALLTSARVPLDSQPARARHGVVLRRRQGGGPPFERSGLQRHEVELGNRGPVPWPDVDADSTRDGPRIRRMASGHLEQRGVLTGRPFHHAHIVTHSCHAGLGAWPVGCRRPVERCAGRAVAAEVLLRRSDRPRTETARTRPKCRSGISVSSPT